MNFFLIGTDHRLQDSDAGFEALLGALLDREYFEPLEAIAEEYHEQSVAHRLAEKRGLRWYDLDMTTDEKFEAGILTEQRKIAVRRSQRECVGTKTRQVGLPYNARNLRVSPL